MISDTLRSVPIPILALPTILSRETSIISVTVFRLHFIVCIYIRGIKSSDARGMSWRVRGTSTEVIPYSKSTLIESIYFALLFYITLFVIDFLCLFL